MKFKKMLLSAAVALFVSTPAIADVQGDLNAGAIT